MRLTIPTDYLCTTNFVQLLWQPFFLYSYWTKAIEREIKRKRIKTHVSTREKVVSKVVKKWLYKYHFSFILCMYLLEKWYLNIHFVTTFSNIIFYFISLLLWFLCKYLLFLCKLWLTHKFQPNGCSNNTPLSFNWLIYVLFE